VLFVKAFLIEVGILTTAEVANGLIITGRVELACERRLSGTSASRLLDSLNASGRGIILSSLTDFERGKWKNPSLLGISHKKDTNFKRDINFIRYTLR
jgi:hypothetical protein